MYDTFESVHQIFERVYQETLADRGVTYMEAQPSGYLVPELADLALLKAIGPGIHDRLAKAMRMPMGGNPIAWVLDPAGMGLVQINSGMCESELVDLARRFYGYSEVS